MVAVMPIPTGHAPIRAILPFFRNGETYLGAHQECLGVVPCGPCPRFTTDFGLVVIPPLIRFSKIKRIRFPPSQETCWPSTPSWYEDYPTTSKTHFEWKRGFFESRYVLQAGKFNCRTGFIY